MEYCCILRDISGDHMVKLGFLDWKIETLEEINKTCIAELFFGIAFIITSGLFHFFVPDFAYLAFIFFMFGLYLPISAISKKIYWRLRCIERELKHE